MERFVKLGHAWHSYGCLRTATEPTVSKNNFVFDDFTDFVSDGPLPIISLSANHGRGRTSGHRVTLVETLAPFGRAKPKRGSEKIGESFPLYSIGNERALRPKLQQ